MLCNKQVTDKRQYLVKADKEIMRMERKKMETYNEDKQNPNVDLEKLNEELLDVLSLVILLENDMEAQKVDSIHIRLIKMVHQYISNDSLYYSWRLIIKGL